MEASAAKTYRHLDAEVRRYGLMCRGGRFPQDDETLPTRDAECRPQTLVLVGNAGADLFRCFKPGNESDEHPLDRWSRSVLDNVAARFGANIVYPFQGPPYWPFLSWAKECESVSSSPIGPLLHPEYGLWHAYRAALLFDERLEVPAKPLMAEGCDTCDKKPCLRACPVDAFSRRDGYDVAGCARHISSEAGRDCLELGCRSRHLCPVGQAYRYSPVQAKFHMAAFLAGRVEG